MINKTKKNLFCPIFASEFIAYGINLIQNDFAMTNALVNVSTDCKRFQISRNFCLFQISVWPHSIFQNLNYFNCDVNLDLPFYCSCFKSIRHTMLQVLPICEPVPCEYVNVAFENRCILTKFGRSGTNTWRHQAVCHSDRRILLRIYISTLQLLNLFGTTFPSRVAIYKTNYQEQRVSEL